MQWPVAPVHLVSTISEPLRPSEIGKHILVTPSGAALRSPSVIVPRMAPHVDHRVEYRGPAEPLAPGLVTPPSVQPRLRHRLERPVLHLQAQMCGHDPDRTGRRADIDLAGLSPRFHKADGGGSILRQAVGKHAARGPSTHDDVVKRVGHRAVPSRRIGAPFSSICPSILRNTCR